MTSSEYQTFALSATSSCYQKRTILHTLSIICYITDMSNTLKQLTVVSSHKVDRGFTFSALHMFSYGNKFVHMIQVGYTNIQSKIKINGLLFDSFILMGGVHRGCTLSMFLFITEAKVLSIFIHANTRINELQIEDHEMEILNFPDNTTLFLLREINCQTRIQSILKLYEKVSSSKIKFSKMQASWAGPYKNKVDKLGQVVWSQLSIKILGVHQNVNQILSSKLWYRGEIYTILKVFKKESEKKANKFI